MPKLVEVREQGRPRDRKLLSIGEYSPHHHHKARHQNGGDDEISVTGLSGLLADDQHVLDNEVVAVAIAKTTVDAQSLLGGITDDTPVAIAIAEQRLVGRITGGNVTALTQAQVETLLLTDSVRYLTMTFPIDVVRIIAAGKPTRVTRGLFMGFSLPIYNNDNEELFSCVCVPMRWDGASDFTVYIGGWLDTANTDKKFKLQVSWGHWTYDDTVPITAHDVEVETETGTAAQYKSFKISFTLDYDVDTPDNVEIGDALAIRIRRIAASADEISGEFVAAGAALIYKINRFGGTSI